MVSYRLTEAGEDLLGVATLLEQWLAEAPVGPLELGEPATKSVITAFVESWSTGMLRALVARPLSLTEISRLISSVSYPSLERRLVSLRATGLVEAQSSRSGGRPHEVAPPLRRAVIPLLGAMRWERRHIPERVPPVGRRDVETAFLLTLPTLALDDEVSGSCRLTVELESPNGSAKIAGATLEVRQGCVASCLARLEEGSEGEIRGSARVWLDAMAGAEAEALSRRGREDLTASLLSGLTSLERL